MIYKYKQKYIMYLYFCNNLTSYQSICLGYIPKLVLLKSLRNCKRRNKGNFVLNSNSNKKMLCGSVGGNIILF